jgi:hypothetical protein
VRGGNEQVGFVDSAAVLPLDGLLHPDEQLAGGGRIDLIAGEVWPQAALDYAIEAGEIDDDDADPGRWLWVDCKGSCPGYRDMQAFICDLDDALCRGTSQRRDQRAWGFSGGSRTPGRHGLT